MVTLSMRNKEIYRTVKNAHEQTCEKVTVQIGMYLVNVA